MDRFFNSFYKLPCFKENIQRISIYYWDDTNVMNTSKTLIRIYPGEDLQNPNYSLYGNNVLNG